MSGSCLDELDGGFALEWEGARRVFLLKADGLNLYDRRYGALGVLLRDYETQHPALTQTRDLVKLALVGGGMAEAEAISLVDAVPYTRTLELLHLHDRILNTALMPIRERPLPPGDAVPKGTT